MNVDFPCIPQGIEAFLVLRNSSNWKKKEIISSKKGWTNPSFSLANYQVILSFINSTDHHKYQTSDLHQETMFNEFKEQVDDLVAYISNKRTSTYDLDKKN